MSPLRGVQLRRLIRCLFLVLVLLLDGVHVLSCFTHAALADPPGESSAPPIPFIKIDIEHVPGEVLVKFREGFATDEIAFVHAQIGTARVSEIRGTKVQLIRGTGGQSTEVLMSAYKNRPEVEYVEPNGIFHTMLFPNDPKFSELWGLHNTGQPVGGQVGTLDADIDGPEAWDLQTGNSDVIVADIDTGVDYKHEDLTANTWTNLGEIPNNGVDDDGNGYTDDFRGWDFVNNDNDPMDDNGHGTHTAGTIAAEGNNAIGVVGVAWQSRIMPLKFLDTFGGGTFNDAAKAIRYAADMGAQISSNSWGCLGSACFSQTIEDAVAYANTKGMLFVVAAGNNANNNDVTITYPCTSSQPNVICVAATDHLDQKAGFSSYGATSVDLGAPGDSILSTTPASPAAPTGNYAYFSGTSMATPHVSGAAALLLAQYPQLSTDQLKMMILNSTDPISALNGLTVTGGRLNVAKALLLPLPPPDMDGDTVPDSDDLCPNTFNTQYTFQDTPLMVKSTTIKTVHVTELRTAINAFRATAGLGAATWSDPTLTAKLTQVKAVHIQEMRDRLNEALTTLQCASPSYTDSVITPKLTVIKAAHIEELRNAVNGKK